MARSDEGVGDDDTLTLEESELPLKYNVFLLDATADDMRRELSHLIVRPCAVGEVPGSLGVPQGTGGFNSRDQDDVVMSDPDDNSFGHGVSYATSTDRLPPNTVDLAQREKDEMRDLTRASEIISLFPDQHPLHPDCSGSSSSASTSSTSSSPVGSLVFGSSGSDEGLLLDDDDEVDIGTTKKVLGSHDGTEWELEYDTLVGGTNPASMARDVYSGIDFGRLLRKEKSGDGKEAGREKKGKMKMGMSDFEMTYVRPGGNAPVDGYGYDICIECHDQAPFPSLAHLKAAEQKVALLEATWKQRVENEREKLVDMRTRGKDDIGELADILPRDQLHIPTLKRCLYHCPYARITLPADVFISAEPVRMHVTDPVNVVKDPKHPGPNDHATSGHSNSETSPKGRRWSSVTSLMASFSSFPLTSQPPPPPSPVSIPSSSRHRSFTNPAPPPFPPKHRSSSPNSTRTRQWSRPLKVLVYSSDGYTESSLTALCLLMGFKSLDLPHAYLELQVNKRRSFFVYQMDLGLLRRVEEYMLEEKKREKEKRDREERERKEREREWEGRYSFMNGSGHLAYSSLFNGGKGGYGFGTHINPHTTWSRASNFTASGDDRKAYRSQVSKSVSFAHPPSETMERGTTRAAAIPISSSLPTLPSSVLDNSMAGKRVQRPRARTSPWLPSLYGGDHQNWFNDPRFDGSFPSRVLPFLYLGNLNHASNVYMLQALGITHVVSVGECALIPPPSSMQSGTGRTHGSNNSTSSRHYIPGKSSDHQGSLWIEEQAGRIKVLDIQGVCDDGIDTLEPQLEPVCDWIDEARQEGGQVLVHCRVGVSRSATVTIAYVMKHLSLPLVDAYLIVRSRRLSVLIQPNMRLLYNLLGWEIKLAKERAGDDERKLRHELSSALTWPYLAKEVHALNEKYLN
ncbi:hypothetical protein D9758_010199 [Tetrapyrgos nigripes]|uniref:Protein-tyrosine-phosphatase n=1 Tax=Tetrapyrgos nigripes TaxID=182062 RepID=A0A8H5FU26_9AGAR|nr:hypothetical protein D9758_010199 [Tetrapyrgos nigripes]